MYRVRVTWTGTPVQGGGLSTFYFNDGGGTAQQAATAVSTFLGTLDANLSTALAWTTEGDVDSIDPATGDLTGTTSVATGSGVGSNVAEVLPPAAQGLLRLRTGLIVAGREVRGRMFIPGFCENNQAFGTPDAGTQANVNNAYATFLADANSIPVVWSRAHGVERVIASGTMWNKWAVLRSRRD